MDVAAESRDATMAFFNFVFDSLGKVALLCGLALMPAEHGGHERTLDTGARAPPSIRSFFTFDVVRLSSVCYDHQFCPNFS